MACFGYRPRPLRLLAVIATWYLIQTVLTVHLCQVCTCVYLVLGPPYISVSCQISSPDFSYFYNVSQFPSAAYKLELNSGDSVNQPVVIPVDAFAPFANHSSSLYLLGFYGFCSLSPIKKGTFRGLKLLRVDFAGLCMDGLPMDALGEQSASLLKIDVFDVLTNESKAIAPPRFHSFEALQTIAISNTPLRSLPNYTFCNLPSLVRVKISRALLTDDGFPRFVFHNVPRLESLQLSHGSFREIPAALSDLRTLKHLELSHNQIKMLDARVLSNLQGLAELDLQGNKIEVVDAAAVEALRNMTSLEVFRLGGTGGQFFLCECELLPFIQWLRESSKHIGEKSDFATYACKYPHEWSGTQLLSPDLVSHLESNCTTSIIPSESTPVNTTEKHEGENVTDPFSPYRIIVPAVAVSVFLSIVGVVSTWMLHRKLKRRWVGLFRRFDTNVSRQSLHNPSSETDYSYDAYVCHHDSATKFVVDEMIPELEQVPDGYRLCLSFRDFLVGADKLDNVATAMQTSRVVIVLLDRDFIASGQCMLELNMACNQMLEAGVGAVPVAASRSAGAPVSEYTAGLLLVLLDALPVDALPTTLRVLRDKITCLEWSTEDSERCWRQLKLALRGDKTYDQTPEFHNFDVTQQLI